MHESKRPGAGSQASMEYETGTTTVGLVADRGVVLATDRRASLGGRFVSNKRAVKVEPVHPTAAITIAGSVGAAQAFVRQLRAEVNLYETRRGEPPSMSALSTLAGNLLRGQLVSPLLGGVDPQPDAEPHLFQLDPGGGVMEDAYAATGSGMQPAYGALERSYDADATLAEAAGAAVDAVAAASERDTASGNGVNLAVVTADGVAVDEYETAEAARAAAEDAGGVA